MPTHGDPQMREVYAEALAGADPASKSLLASGGSEGNLASNAALESTRPSIETATSWTRVQESEPSVTDQALIQPGPLASTKGSPSQEPNVRMGEATATSTKPLPGQHRADVRARNFSRFQDLPDRFYNDHIALAKATNVAGMTTRAGRHTFGCSLMERGRRRVRCRVLVRPHHRDSSPGGAP